MTVYIALLRGINVGGNNKVKMAELKSACEELGLRDVRTYIQSGNIVFRSERSESELRELLEELLRGGFGVKKSVVLLRTNAELQRILSDCPFTQAQIEAASQLYVHMLDKPLDEEQAARIGELAAEGEQCVVRGRELYLLLTPGILDSVFAILFQKMKLPLTARNWNTMNKLGELAAQAEV
ncbi:DUF1697 domain-containing protein [Cohnella sp. JJ-181]|uniref:DUF1697 domain-containing protein n=1 Tax=Cohnella rhizoplanae TaxID=2974897 RepID=UPI0022FF85B6|nr:DUF1697 domain-containing protein [Cohnella sp. JJ-181]CAI6031625.1 hypothetical protein COHCIP112018_00726 [Cohnella sp. JJ-181]